MEEFLGIEAKNRSLKSKFRVSKRTQKSFNSISIGYSRGIGGHDGIA
jgi:hypothetical protein